MFRLDLCVVDKVFKASFLDDELLNMRLLSTQDRRYGHYMRSIYYKASLTNLKWKSFQDFERRL